MPRLRPARWILCGVMVLIGTVGGLAALGRVKDVLTFPAAAAISLGIGLALGVLILLVFAGSDTRRAVLLDRHDGAVVENAFVKPTLLTDLEALTGSPISPRGVGRSVTMVADATGVRFFRGYLAPVELATIPWSRIRSVGNGVAVPASWSTPAGARLRLEIGARDDSTPEHEVQFSVERVSAIPGGSLTIDEAGIADLATVLEAQRGRVAPSRRRGEHKDLPVQPTAWAASRVGSIPLFALVVAIQALAIALVLVGRLLLTSSLVWAAAGVFAIGGIVIYTSLRRLARISAAEGAQGYTTLNRAYLDREQRHPRTGVVLRAAGAPPLSKQEFAEALRQ